MRKKLMTTKQALILVLVIVAGVIVVWQVRQRDSDTMSESAVPIRQSAAAKSTAPTPDPTRDWLAYADPSGYCLLLD